MIRLLYIILLFCITFTHANTQPLITWFSDDFQQLALDPKWHPASSEWKLLGGVLTCDTKQYDQLLSASYYIYGQKSFTIEVTLRGNRAGVYFSLDDTASKALSHMVRFDERTLLTGYFNGAGEYVATNTYETLRSLTDWTVLRLEINPRQRRYDVYVNERRAITDTILKFPSGWFGLQASDGLSEFKSIRVSSDQYQGKLDGLGKGNTVSFNHIRSIMVGKQFISVYDQERDRVQIFDSEGRVQSSRRVKGPILQPPVASVNKRTYHIERSQVVVKDATGAIIDSIKDRLAQPSAILADSSGVYVADIGINGIMKFSHDGKFLAEFTASTLNGFIAPRGMDFFGKDEILVADYNRIVRVPKSLTEEHPSVQMPSPSEAHITWPRTVSDKPPVNATGRWNPERGVLQLKSDSESEWTTVSAEMLDLRKTNSATLTNLKPLTRYSYRVSAPFKTIPPSKEFSREFRFTTSPSDFSMTSYTRLPVLCMVYRTISYRDVYPKERYPHIPDGRTITNEEIAYLKEACRFNEEFYFRNSSCKLVLDFDFHVIEDTLWLNDVGNKDPYWLSVTDRVTRDYENTTRRFGNTPEYYNGLIVPYAWLNYPPRRTSALRDSSKSDSINIRQMYGGGTYGVPAPWKYGTKAGYTGNPFQDRFSRQDWLITHEFHHQIDALMEASGYPEYHHADQPWKMPGRFGEDFDFNAQIIRNGKPEWWLNLKFGKLEQTGDADLDGVPDNDPALPFDEQRLNGDNMSVDTDQDGLIDMREVMAGTSRGTLLNDIDTDSDGINDGEDGEPFYRLENRWIEVVDNIADAGASDATLVTDSLSVFLSFAWTRNELIINTTCSRPANVLLQIDANNDGWFHGFDNFQIRVNNTADSASVAEYYLRDCSSWSNSPPDRKDILKHDDLRILRGIQGGVLYEGNQVIPRTWYTLTIRVPRNDTYGLKLENGKKLGFRLGLQSTNDRWVWEELFERNYMMSVELGGEY